MRAAAYPLLVALVGTLITAGAAQEPPPPGPASPPATEATPAPAPAPAPAVVAGEEAAPAPAFSELMDPASHSGFRRPEQPPYGRVLRPSPAQELAMLEAGQSVLATDPRVAAAAVLLERLTAAYVEDAPRIAELTIHVVQQVRAANQAASPMELLAGAIQWKGPGGRRGNVPREFEQFAALYRTGRIAGKDHATTLTQMQPAGTAPAGAPIP